MAFQGPDLEGGHDSNSKGITAGKSESFSA